MEIQKGIEIVMFGLLIKNSKTLIIGDIHLGKEEALRKSGLLIPTNEYNEILELTKKIIKKSKPKLIIVNGDLKHHFGLITNNEWDKILKFLKFLSDITEIKLIKGNHDKILKPIADKLQIPLVSYHKEKNIYITHGDKIPTNEDYKKSRTVIIGHEHPAVRLTDGVRSESYKCFLKGKFDKKTLIVMPSLTPLSEGTNVLAEKLISPFLQQSKIKNFEAYLIGEKIYHFGKLKNLDTGH